MNTKMEKHTNIRKIIIMKTYLLYLIFAFYPLLINAHEPDTLVRNVKLVQLDTSSINLPNPFKIPIQKTEIIQETKKLSVIWKRKISYNFTSMHFQKRGLIFDPRFFWRRQKDSGKFVLDLNAGNKVYLGRNRWRDIFKQNSPAYICYPKIESGFILADLSSNKIIKELPKIPPRRNYPFFPKDVILYQEKVERKGRERGYRIIYAYDIKNDSILWSKDEVHKRIIGYENGKLIREELGEYNYIKDWRVTEDYLIIDGAFPESPRRLYFFDKYSFTIKKAYPYPGKYYYKFHGDTLYWFVKAKDRVEKMYAVDYRNDQIYWGLKRKTMKLNFKGDYLVFDDREPGVIFVNRKTGEPVKQINTVDNFHLTSFDYLNGNIISTVSSKNYMPRMSKDIRGYYDVLIDVSSLKQYKLEELSTELCQECIQPKDPVDCVNQLKYLNIQYKDYIYAELKCGEYYYLLCLKIEETE